MQTLQSLVRDAESNYLQGTSKLGKYVEYSMYDTVETIDAYLNSKHISGDKDALGREKPFFNMVIAAVNIWYRATDLDRRHIKVMPDSITSVPLAFIATLLLQQWMDKNRFGVFLNQWGRALARYGSAVVKFIEKDGNLEPSVIPWNRFVADPIDFNAIPHIEKFYKTPAQLKKITGYDKKVVNDLIQSHTTRKTLEGFNKDEQSNFIEIYEVHGELSQAIYKKAKGEKVRDGDEDIYFQQMHVISFIKNSSGEYDDFTLYVGREKKNPYMITHLIEEDGRTLSIGAVEYLFDAQWMQNHSMKQWKDQLDLASKIIFQTADTNFIGRNVLSAMQSGDIMIHAPNAPLTQVNNAGHDITSVQGFMSQWRVLSQEITSTPDAIRGNAQPSGTAYRSVAIQQQEANSLFELMTENKALAIEDMLKMFVIPHLKTKVDNTDEIMALLDDHAIAEFDAMFIPKEAIKRYNERTINDLITNPLPTPANPLPSFNPGAEQAQIKQELISQGNKRSITPEEVSWKKLLSDIKWDNVKVEITNENKDKQAVMETLTTLFQTLAQTDPTKANIVLNKIMTETGAISPLELGSSTASPPQNIGGQQVGAGMGALAGNMK